MRIDILEKKEEILKLIEEKIAKSKICEIINCKPSTLNRYLIIWEINYKGTQGKNDYKIRKNSLYYIDNKKSIGSHKLKLKLIEDGIKEHKCENCNLVEWFGSKIPIELHHIDGNRYNNNLENLQILCPNCHAKTDNNSGKALKKIRVKVKKKEKREKLCKCGKIIYDRSNSCRVCYNVNLRKVKRPTHEQLLKEVEELGYSAVGRKYGVSDNAIRKWLKYSVIVQ